MKTYSNKSNAKRAGISAISNDRGIDKDEVKANTDKYFTIEGDSNNGFYPRYISDRVHGVSAEKEAELKAEREAAKKDDFDDSVNDCRREMTFDKDGNTVPVEEVKVEKPKAAKKVPQKAAPKTTGIKIQKDREEQNGVVRPSAGGACAAVWGYCDAQMDAQGVPPQLKQVKSYAADMNWNINNATIEYYQWRKFHGIVGRIKAPK